MAFSARLSTQGPAQSGAQPACALDQPISRVQADRQAQRRLALSIQVERGAGDVGDTGGFGGRQERAGISAGWQLHLDEEAAAR